MCAFHTQLHPQKDTQSRQMFSQPALACPFQSINQSTQVTSKLLISCFQNQNWMTQRLQEFALKKLLLASVFHFFLTKKGGGRREGSDRDQCLKRNSEPSKRKSSPATAAVSGFNALSTIIRSTISPVATGTIFCSLPKTTHDNITSHNHLISKPIRV